MSFLVLVLAVWIEKFSALRSRVQRDGLWLRELARLESSARLGKQPWLILVLLVLLPVALLGLLLLVLEPVAYGLLALPVHLLVVIYSLGRGDLLASWGRFVMPGAGVTCKRLNTLPSATWPLAPTAASNCWSGSRAICCGRPTRAFSR
jgi:membrane protein required for beta-lactamase induction